MRAVQKSSIIQWFGRLWFVALMLALLGPAGPSATASDPPPVVLTESIIIEQELDCLAVTQSLPGAGAEDCDAMGDVVEQESQVDFSAEDAETLGDQCNKSCRWELGLTGQGPPIHIGAGGGSQ